MLVGLLEMLELNPSKKVWDDVGSKVEVRGSDGTPMQYRLLGIVADEIRTDEKVTKIWNSGKDKSGKATPIDRILLICPENSEPEIF